VNFENYQWKVKPNYKLLKYLGIQWKTCLAQIIDKFKDSTTNIFSSKTWLFNTVQIV